jgi:hypothetical protein
MPTRKGHTDLMWPSRKRRRVHITKFREMPVNDLVGCRDMELLCRRRAALDIQHSWMWLGEAERWRDLARRETASRFQTTGPGPITMGPNTIEGDYRNR